MTIQTNFQFDNGPAELDFFMSMIRRHEVSFSPTNSHEPILVIITGILGKVGSIRQWEFFGYVTKSSLKDFPSHTRIQGFFDYRNGRKGFINRDPSKLQ